MQLRSGSRAAGFTLIEIMITVAIIAILAAIAFASYRNQIIRSNRSAAQTFMLDVASKEERYLLDFRNYADSLSALGIAAPPEVSRNYTVTLSVNAALPEPNYTVSATPIGAQLSDDTDCGTLTLTHLGTKGATGGGANCWR